MAVVNASTWTEFAAGFAVNNTVKLTADIDCNNEIPEGFTNTFAIYLNGWEGVTVDGSYIEDGVSKNHIIRNLRSNVASPTPFTTISTSNYNETRTVTFKNVDFTNLIIDRPFIEFSGNISKLNILFENCGFVGRRTQNFINTLTAGNGDRTLTFKSCFFNLDYVGTSNTYVPLNAYTSYLPAVANYCRIKQNYTGWDIGTAADPFNAVQNTTHNLKMNGCYLSGTFVGTGDSSYARINVTRQYSYDGALQNVVDADFRLGGTPTASMDCSIVAPKGIFVNQIRKLNDDNVFYTPVNYNSTGNAKAIPINPNDMTDAQALYDAGFDVIVPA